MVKSAATIKMTARLGERWSCVLFIVPSRPRRNECRRSHLRPGAYRCRSDESACRTSHTQQCPCGHDCQRTWYKIPRSHTAPCPSRSALLKVALVDEVGFGIGTDLIQTRRVLTTSDRLELSLLHPVD